MYPCYLTVSHSILNSVIKKIKGLQLVFYKFFVITFVTLLLGNFKQVRMKPFFDWNKNGCLWWIKWSYNTSHKFWDKSLIPHYHCCLQISETGSWHKLRCCYSSNMLQHWVGRRWQIYFYKVGHSRISIDFFQELTWSQ